MLGSNTLVRFNCVQRRSLVYSNEPEGNLSTYHLVTCGLHLSSYIFNIVRGHENGLSNDVNNVSVNSKCYHPSWATLGAFDQNFCLGQGFDWSRAFDLKIS